VQCGAASRLVALGDQILLRATESKLRKGITRLHSVVDDPKYAAWAITRDGNLALVFDYLGLDGYLRHHARPLSIHGKADVMRALIGELVESGDPVVLPRMECCKYSSKVDGAKALLRALIGTLLDLGILPASSPRHDVDSKLVSLLRSGDVQSLVARCRMLHEESKPLFRRQLNCTITNMLPQLNVMRLLVFVQALCLICRDDTRMCAMQRKSGKSLASSLAGAVISAHLWQLPYDNIEQLNDIRDSADLTREDSEQLVQLMVPVGFFEVITEGSTDGARFDITQKLKAPQLELIAREADTLRGGSTFFGHASMHMEGGLENAHTAYGNLAWQQTSQTVSALEALHGSIPGGSQGLKDDRALVRTVDGTEDLQTIRSNESRMLSEFEGKFHHSSVAPGEQCGAQDDYASQLGLAAAEFLRMAHATC